MDKLQYNKQASDINASAPKEHASNQNQRVILEDNRPSYNIETFHKSKANQSPDRINAVLYGFNDNNININLQFLISKKAITTIMNTHGKSMNNCKYIIHHKGQQYEAIIKELQYSILKDNDIIHVDFFYYKNATKFNVLIHPNFIYNNKRYYKQLNNLSGKLANSYISNIHPIVYTCRTPSDIPFCFIITLDNCVSSEQFSWFDAEQKKNHNICYLNV